MDWGAVGTNMLSAAASAAGGDWNTIEGDLKNFVTTLTANGDSIATQAANGGWDDREIADQLAIMGDLAAMVADYATVALKKAAQDAANAAIGVLVTAIKAAIP